MKNQRSLGAVDRFLAGTGAALNTIFASARASRPCPAHSEDGNLTPTEARQSVGYMRVNHVGEVCAQALYQSQALTSRNPEIAEQMRQAAIEETDHLAWCETRLGELGASRSVLNPLWYAGSFALGAAAGLAGDKWNLGFVAETEKQVVAHLESHLARLPRSDLRSREIVSQMKQDESAHAELAMNAGAAPLPDAARWLMRRVSSVMTRTAYYV